MKTLSRRMLIVLVAMFAAAPALPAAYGAVKTVKGPEEGKPWLHWIVTLVVAGACGVVVFMNAKRSHQA